MGIVKKTVYTCKTCDAIFSNEKEAKEHKCLFAGCQGCACHHCKYQDIKYIKATLGNKYYPECYCVANKVGVKCPKLGKGIPINCMNTNT